MFLLSFFSAPPLGSPACFPAGRGRVNYPRRVRMQKKKMQKDCKRKRMGNVQREGGWVGGWVEGRWKKGTGNNHYKPSPPSPPPSLPLPIWSGREQDSFPPPHTTHPVLPSFLPISTFTSRWPDGERRKKRNNLLNDDKKLDHLLFPPPPPPEKPTLPPTRSLYPSFCSTD